MSATSLFVMEKKPVKRTPLTPEQIADAERLKVLFNQRATCTQAEFAHRYDLKSQGNLWQYLNGKIALNVNSAAKFAQGLGIKVSDFSPRLAGEIERVAESELSTSDEFELVPRADVQVSAGHGQVIYEEGSKSSLSFRRSFLREIGVTPANAVVVTVKGRSMEPDIPDGAVLLISTVKHALMDGQIYAFRDDGELYVKRCVFNGGTPFMVSANPDRDLYPDMRLPSGGDPDFEIIGRALWFGARL